MIKYYEFKEINKIDLDDKKEIIKNHKFLYKSVSNEIKYYEDNNEKKFINYFEKIFFEIKEIEVKSNKNDFFACHLSGDEKNISDIEISRLLRNSDTLKINEYNCYDNKDIKVVFSENGFVFIAKFDEQKDKFERIYILYLLAQAYNLYTEKLMMEVSSFYKEEELDKMLELRKEIYIFDLNCFFSNPVIYKKQQMHTLWAYLHNIYSVELNHKEMKSQVKDLVNLIEIDIREKERIERLKEKEREEKLYRIRKEEREREKREEEKLYRIRKEEREEEKKIQEERYLKLEKEKEEQNKRTSKRTTILTTIGIIIAMFSLGSVYADLVELGALPNVFENKTKPN